jgi:hypothetical protein
MTFSCLVSSQWSIKIEKSQTIQSWHESNWLHTFKKFLSYGILGRYFGYTQEQWPLEYKCIAFFCK